MKTYKLNLLAICTAAILFTACKKGDAERITSADGRVSFNLPATTDVVAQSIQIKDVILVSTELKAALQGDASSDVHYITFTTDTTKITDYRAKYGSTALLLPTTSYLFYKPTVAIGAGATVSDAAVLNLSFQTALRAQSTYVLPLVIASIDGQPQDPKTRRVVYYVFNTGDALYVDHTGFTLGATASSTAGTNTASKAIDAATGTTYWASATTSTLPQYVSIDFARNITFSGLDYFSPTPITTATGGIATSAKVETSLDGITWTDKGTFAIDVNNAAKKQTINMPTVTTARYLRFTILAATTYASIYNIGFVGGILLRN